jgi:hypothetical protein
MKSTRNWQTVFLALCSLEFSTLLFVAAPMRAEGGADPARVHSDAGLTCTDCHLFFGDATSQTGDVNGAFLLKANVTDLCLACHTEGKNTPHTADLPNLEDRAWVAPIVMTADGGNPAELGVAMPAGDFYWSNRDPGKGHNPAFAGGVPTSQQLAADPVLGTSPPGGDLAGGDWSCVSCHGPHSRFDDDISAWRQLKRRINGRVVTGDVRRYGVENVRSDAIQDPQLEPLLSNSRGLRQGEEYVASRADGHPLEGADLFRPEGDANKNVYRGGFSSFCAACHGDFHGGQGENARAQAGDAWARHPSNLELGRSSRYSVAAYTGQVINAQGTSPNPAGYDWKYPLVKADGDFTLRPDLSAAGAPGTVRGEDRIMCLTCHRAHAAPYENMTRWETRAHSFIADGERDFTGEPSQGDNPAYGCGKCHQMGGLTAYVKRF